MRKKAKTNSVGKYVKWIKLWIFDSHKAQIFELHRERFIWCCNLLNPYYFILNYRSSLSSAIFESFRGWDEQKRLKGCGGKEQPERRKIGDCGRGMEVFHSHLLWLFAYNIELMSLWANGLNSVFLFLLSIFYFLSPTLSLCLFIFELPLFLSLSLPPHPPLVIYNYSRIICFAMLLH